MRESERVAKDTMENNGEEEGTKVLASFHRIIMPSVVRESRLVLPRKFVDEYGDQLSKTLKLSLPPHPPVMGGAGNNIWYVGLKRNDGLLYLRVGWEKFMKHYSIRFGYLLLFKYKGNSEFDVHVFDLTTTEIQYPVSGSDHTTDDHRRTSEHGLSGKGYTCSDDVKLEDVDGDEYGATLVTPRSKRKAILTTDLDPALADAEKYETKNPFLIVKLKGYNLRKNMLYLPRTFTRDHMMDGCSGFIEILDSDNMKWMVRFRKCDRDRLMLTSGWMQFVNAQGLKTGDVCVFELITTAVMKVTVFHAKPRKLSKKSQVQADAAKCTNEKLTPALVTVEEMYKKIKNPFFIIELKDYNVNMLHLPRSFTREHMSAGSLEFIEILDSYNMKWSVRVYNDHGRMTLCSGWTHVVKAEGLGTGDVCVFELIAADVMKVSVTHAKP